MPILELMVTIVLFYPTLPLLVVSSILRLMIKISWHHGEISFIGFSYNKPHNLEVKHAIKHYANEIVSTNKSCSTNSHTLFWLIGMSLDCNNLQYIMALQQIPTKSLAVPQPITMLIYTSLTFRLISDK